MEDNRTPRRLRILAGAALIWAAFIVFKAIGTVPADGFATAVQRNEFLLLVSVVVAVPPIFFLILVLAAGCHIGNFFFALRGREGHVPFTVVFFRARNLSVADSRNQPAAR